MTDRNDTSHSDLPKRKETKGVKSEIVKFLGVFVAGCVTALAAIGLLVWTHTDPQMDRAENLLFTPSVTVSQASPSIYSFEAITIQMGRDERRALAIPLYRRFFDLIQYDRGVGESLSKPLHVEAVIELLIRFNEPGAAGRTVIQRITLADDDEHYFIDSDVGSSHSPLLFQHPGVLKGLKELLSASD
ncbi:MAG: hypothetical protein KDK40_04570 [Chlamydiia bacterium]|nr:hypothetical protein [Chlamydiia bacterium]